MAPASRHLSRSGTPQSEPSLAQTFAGTVEVVVVVAAVDVVVDVVEVVVVAAGVVLVVVTGSVVVVEVGNEVVEVVLVDAAAVVVVVDGGAGMTVAVTVDEPVAETRPIWMTPAVLIDDEPVARSEAFGASIPEFARTNFEEPSTVMSAVFPGTSLIAGVAGVFPLSVSCDEPVTTSRPPVSLLHARVSFEAVAHASTSVESGPVTFDELVTLKFPASQ